MLTVVKYVNSLLHFVFGKSTVKGVVAHLCTPILVGWHDADLAVWSLNVAPELRIVIAGSSNKNTARPRVEGPPEAIDSCR